MMELKKKTTEQIIDSLCELDMQKRITDRLIKSFQAELQKRGFQILEDRNIKHTEFFGSGGNIADITFSQKLDIINFAQLDKIGGEIVKEYIKRTEEIKYTVDSKFKDVLIAIFNDDYNTEMTVDEILHENFDFDPVQKRLLLKKLKGDYKKDKANILAALDKKETEIDIDVELGFIYRAKNWEKIKRFFPDCFCQQKSVANINEKV